MKTLLSLRLKIYSSYFAYIYTNLIIQIIESKLKFTFILCNDNFIYPKLLRSTPWSKKTFTRFFSGSKNIAEIVLYEIDKETRQVFN
jgi:hypothetical protein